MSKSKNDIPVALIVIIVIVILIIYLASLGSINPSNLGFPQEYKDDKAEAKRRHKKLTEHIAKQEALKEKLDKIFKRIFCRKNPSTPLVRVATLRYQDSDSFSTTSFLASTREQSSHRFLSGSIVSL